MAAEGTGGSKLAELVTDHIFLDINGNVLAAVIDRDGVADEGGEDRGAAAPGLEDLLPPPWGWSQGFMTEPRTVGRQPM